MIMITIVVLYPW